LSLSQLTGEGGMTQTRRQQKNSRPLPVQYIPCSGRSHAECALDVNSLYRIHVCHTFILVQQTHCLCVGWIGAHMCCVYIQYKCDCSICVDCKCYTVGTDLCTQTPRMQRAWLFWQVNCTKANKFKLFSIFIFLKVRSFTDQIETFNRSNHKKSANSSIYFKILFQFQNQDRW